MNAITINLAKYKELRLRDFAEARWKYEIAGCKALIEDKEITLKTDRESRAALYDVAVQANADPSYTVEWKTPEGWITLDAKGIAAAAKAVREHVQAAYQKEIRAVEAIRQATTLDEVKAITFE